MNQHPPEALNAALEKGIAEGLFLRPADETALAQVLASLNSVMSEGQAAASKIVDEQWEERLSPIEVSSLDEIPFGLGHVLFLDGRSVDVEVATSILRDVYKDVEAVCLIGPIPIEAHAEVKGLITAGHQVYMLPRDANLMPGCRRLQPPEFPGSSSWREIEVE